MTSYNYRPRLTCRICLTKTEQIANLGDLALTCSFPRPGEDAPIIPLTIRRCPLCGLVQTGESTNPALMYTPDYGYKSGTNETMRRHLDDIAQKCRDMYEHDSYSHRYIHSQTSVLDIGCNDGTLLERFKQHGFQDLTGYDPTADDVAGATIVKDYFHATGKKYDIITSIAMFYDLEDPVAFAKDIAISLADDGVWIVEVQYAGAIQEGKWDQIIHEHLEYYGLKQIVRIASIVGLRVVEFSFNDTNGGCLQCVLKHRGQHTLPYSDPHLVLPVIQAEDRWEWTDLDQLINLSAKNIRHMINGRRIHVLGASSKGNTLLQKIWASGETIEAAIERNPDKIGRRTPGTNIPIRDEEWSWDNKPQAFLVLPYHFRESILDRYKRFHDEGVQFIFPLPNVEVI